MNSEMLSKVIGGIVTVIALLIYFFVGGVSMWILWNIIATHIFKAYLLKISLGNGLLIFFLIWLLKTLLSIQEMKTEKEENSERR